MKTIVLEFETKIIIVLKRRNCDIFFDTDCTVCMIRIIQRFMKQELDVDYIH